MAQIGNGPSVIVCLASYFKGGDFLRQASELGARVFLVTREMLCHEPWPHEVIEDIVFVSDHAGSDEYLRSVSNLAQRIVVDRIVALEEFDVVTAGHIREHLALPGMTGSSARLFRDKLLMRRAARAAGIAVPAFALPLNPFTAREYTELIPGPWMLKPRSDVSAIGIKKLDNPDQLWERLNELNSREAFKETPGFFVLERFVPGQVFHVDSLVSGGKVVFALANQYGRPPMDVAHGGGIFISHNLKFGSAETRSLHQLNRKIIKTLGLSNGVAHAEFIRSDEDGQLYFLEIAARVGGAYLADTFEAASGLSLWREWAKIELSAGTDDYSVNPLRCEYAGIALSLARQEHPDTSLYDDPEIAFRVNKPFHVGLVVRSPNHERVVDLLYRYQSRFTEDFCAVAPPRERVE
jgi:biotin carboxylase